MDQAHTEMTDREAELRDFYFLWIKRSLILHFGGALLAIGMDYIPESLVSQTLVTWIVFIGFAISIIGVIDFTGLFFQRKKVFAAFVVADQYDLKPVHPTLFLLQWWRSLQ